MQNNKSGHYLRLKNGDKLGLDLTISDRKDLTGSYISNATMRYPDNTTIKFGLHESPDKKNRISVDVEGGSTSLTRASRDLREILQNPEFMRKIRFERGESFDDFQRASLKFVDHIEKALGKPELNAPLAAPKPRVLRPN